MRRRFSKILSSFVIRHSLSKARRLVPLHVEAIDVEGDGGLLLAGAFGGEVQLVLDGEGVLLLVLVRAFRHLPIAGDVLDDHEVDGRLLEVFDFDFVNLVRVVEDDVVPVVAADVRLFVFGLALNMALPASGLPCT